MNLTFQGLVVDTNQFGPLPWFEAALVSLSSSDRQEVYNAKRMRGDTHCIVSFTWSYTEPGQPYVNVTGRDFTNDIPSYIEMVREVVREGFTPLLFLGGDDGENGFPVAVSQVEQLGPALSALLPYVVVVPGWDGVFYGYTPQHVADFATAAREAGFLYVGLEHSVGNIPVGGGPGDYHPGGLMEGYDVVLSEFSNYPERGDQLWQVAARLLGPSYHRPADQPSGDDLNPPYYLAGGSSRGPYFVCAFEFNEFNFVRDANVGNCESARAYLRSLGFTNLG